MRERQGGSWRGSIGSAAGGRANLFDVGEGIRGVCMVRAELNDLLQDRGLDVHEGNLLLGVCRAREGGRAVGVSASFSATTHLHPLSWSPRACSCSRLAEGPQSGCLPVYAAQFAAMSPRQGKRRRGAEAHLAGQGDLDVSVSHGDSCVRRIGNEGDCGRLLAA